MKMKQLHKYLLLSVALLLTSFYTSAQAIDLRLDPANARNMTFVEQADGSYSITATSGDPNVDSLAIPATYDSNSYVVIEFEYKSALGLDDLQVFYRNSTQGPSPERRALFGPVPAAADWTTYTGYLDISGVNWSQAYEVFRFDFGRIAGRNIEVRDIVLRELTEQEILDRLPKEQVDIELDINSTSPNLTAFEFSDGSYQLDTTGGDPWIRTKTLSDVYDPDQSYIISFEYRAEQQYNGLEIFYGRPDSGTRRIELPALPAAADWQAYVINTEIEKEEFREAVYANFRLDFGKQEFEDKTIFIRNLQIRKPTPEEVIEEQNSDKVVSAKRNQLLLDHLDKQFVSQVTAVVVKPTSIEISGSVASIEGVLLADLPVEENYFDTPQFTSTTTVSLVDGSFNIIMDRFVDTDAGQIDRLYSRWMLVEEVAEGQYELVSDPRWADDVAEAAQFNFVEKKAETIKGLDGLTARTLSNIQDLVDLDVKSMKVNLILSNIYAVDSIGIEHQFNNKTFYMSTANVTAFDKLVKASNENDLALGVVLLIPTNLGNPIKRELFNHPDADRGLYSMPNVTTAEGVEAYSATMDFLAKRYSDPSSEFGRIAYWIIHNEVDAHQTWTYAGKKPEALYGDLYQKSMRIVYYSARKYDPTAKVYASYTHHWNKKAGGNEQNFKPKDMLARLEQYSARQGDFEWGIGYHSYPLNLFNPKTWNDAAAQTQHNLDTNYITPRNLEMIDVYARQFSALYQGKKVRTVILSENGMSSNTARLPAATLENQAAGIAFFWKKVVQGLDSIENIQYHRWVDNPNEAGLEFGLWTNGGENPDDFGTKKPSWFVWEAAGTDDEDNVFAPYLPVVGIQDWAELKVDIAKQTTPFKVDLAIDNCSADQLFVSFNGERKRPQADGSVQFFNVASNVEQPLSIKNGDYELASDVLDITQDTQLNYDFGIIDNFRARIATPRSITFAWDIDTQDADAVSLYVKNENDEFDLVDRVASSRKFSRHLRLQRNTRYEYKLVPELAGQALCAASLTQSTTNRGVIRND